MSEDYIISCLSAVIHQSSAVVCLHAVRTDQKVPETRQEGIKAPLLLANPQRTICKITDKPGINVDNEQHFSLQNGGDIKRVGDLKHLISARVPQTCMEASVSLAGVLALLMCIIKGLLHVAMLHVDTDEQ